MLGHTPERDGLSILTYTRNWLVSLISARYTALHKYNDSWGANIIMRLTPPSRIIFLIAVVLALLAFLAHYFQAAIPMVNGNAFGTLLLGFLLLLAGNLFRNL